MLIKNSSKQKIAAVLGNLLEWYDFAIYGYFAEEISRVFFPELGKQGLIASFAVFMVGFLSRPLGAVVFGYFGDRHGRRLILLTVFPLMFLSTAIIGILPTYEQLGIGAQLLLILVRMLQGISLGCQYTTSITYLAEIKYAEQKRAVHLSYPWVFANLGFIFAALITYFYLTFVVDFISPNWQWRLPFLTSLIGIPVFLWQKRHLQETIDFQDLQKQNTVTNSNNPFECIKLYPKVFFTTVILISSPLIAYATLFIFLVNSSFLFAGLSREFLIFINIIGLTAQTIMIPIFGKLTDKTNHKFVYYMSTLILLVLIYPAFLGFELHIPWLSLFILAILGAVCAGFCAPMSIMMVDNYPAKYRLSGTSVSYNSAAALFGATAPMVCSSLVFYFHNFKMPALYIILWCVFGLVGAFNSK